MTALDLAGNGKAPSRADTLTQWSRALSVLLFLASIAALIFQLGWQGALVRHFGDDAERMTILVLALGLGVGSLLGGLLSRLLSQGSPLLLLAALGAMHGACGAIWPSIDVSTDTTPLGWAFAVEPMLASTLLTGAMLPAVLEPLTRPIGNAGSAFGDSLFAVMLGAAVACLVSGAVL